MGKAWINQLNSFYQTVLINQIAKLLKNVLSSGCAEMNTKDRGTACTSFFFGDDRRESWGLLGLAGAESNLLPAALVWRPLLCEHGARVGDFK